MTRLHELYEVGGQSPWLDNLRRGWITSGELAQWVDNGCRGITSNPSIFQKAMSSSADYDADLRSHVDQGDGIEETYWSLVTADITAALEILRPVYDSSAGLDGFVSVEVSPAIARDTAATETAARALHERIDEPNLYVKIPGTVEGVAAVQTMISEGHSINVTLIFSLDRYAAIIEAYLAGLEAHGGDLSGISSVASFFVSRVDTEIDRRLDAIGTPVALALRGRAAVAQAQLAYRLSTEMFSGPRWEALEARGARPQRPLWASTSTKNPAYPDTLYVDSLIGPGTVNTIPDATIDAFEDHGVVQRTIDADFDAAAEVLADVAAVGVDLDSVSEQLEDEGVAAFEKSFDELLATLAERADTIGA